MVGQLGATVRVVSFMQNVLDLPPLLRLALGYAPHKTHGLFASLFAWDHQMANIVARHSDPLLAQIKLAWWRDLLAGTGTASGDVTFKFNVTAWAERVQDLSPVVDGWEEMLAQSPDFFAVAAGRAAPFRALAGSLGYEAVVVEDARVRAMRWALIDLHDRLSQPTERRDVCLLAAQLPPPRCHLPRAMRPLAVLDGLAKRALRRGGGALLGDRLSPLAAIRLGIFGR